MTAHDIITEIERLPAEEQAKVVDYFRRANATKVAKFIPPAEAGRLGREILRHQPDVFRRLSATA